MCLSRAEETAAATNATFKHLGVVGLGEGGVLSFLKELVTCMVLQQVCCLQQDWCLQQTIHWKKLFPTSKAMDSLELGCGSINSISSSSGSLIASVGRIFSSWVGWGVGG